MSSALSLIVNNTALTCGECGIVFSVPTVWYQKRVSGEDGNRSFSCPNGHSRAFCDETEAQKLRRQLAQEQQKTAMERNQRIEAETKLKRVQRRVAAGVCPVAGCKRTVRQLAQHIEKVHPDYKKVVKK